jgi:hypothetical protein
LAVVPASPLHYRSFVGLLVLTVCLIVIVLMAEIALLTGDTVFGVFMAMGIFLAGFYVFRFSFSGELHEDGTLEFRGPLRSLTMRAGEIQRIRERRSSAGIIGYWIDAENCSTWIWNCPNGRAFLRVLATLNPGLDMPVLNGS